MRNKHIGFVVEPEVHDELRSIAEGEFSSLSNLLYRIVKKWLKKHSSEKGKKAQD